MFLRRRHVLPDRRAARVGAGARRSSTRSTTASQLVRARRASASRAGPTSCHVAFLVGFALVIVAAGDLADGQASLDRASSLPLEGHAAGAGHRAGRPAPGDRAAVRQARRPARAPAAWPSAGTPTSRRPASQLEHERHLKAINEAADQLERARRGVARRARSRATRSRSAPPPRASAAPRRARAPTPRSSASARRAPTSQQHDPFGSRVPDHSVVHRYARCLSYPEWGVGSVNGIYFTGDGDDIQQWARVVVPGRHPHRAGRLAAVRRLLQARPGRRARRSAS